MENYKNAKKIFSASDEMEAEIIVSLLEANEILSYKKGQGNSDLMHVYAGNSVQGIDIMVAEENEEKALLLLRNYKLETEHTPKTFHNTKKRISQAVILFCMILIICITIWALLFY